MSAQKTHQVTGFIFRVEGDKIYVLLIRRMYFDGGFAWKPPSGTNGAYLAESPEETLDRAVLIEAGLDVINAIPLPRADVENPADPGLNRGPQTQKWFFINNYAGDFRTGRISNDKEHLDPPEWIPVDEALGETGERHLVPRHRNALKVALSVRTFVIAA